jgi:hypothetical protein
MEWSASEVMGTAWEGTKANFGVLIGAIVVVGAINWVLAMILNAVFHANLPPEAYQHLQRPEQILELVQEQQKRQIVPSLILQIPSAFFAAGVM